MDDQGRLYEHTGSGDRRFAWRDETGKVESASGPIRTTETGLTGPPADLPNDPEGVAEMNAHPEDWREVPMRQIYPPE